MTGLDSCIRVGPIGAVAVGLGPVAVRAAHGLEVGAGAERAALAEQHRHGGVGIRVEVAERLGQRGRGRAVHGVAHVGPVQDDGRDRPAPLDPDVLALAAVRPLPPRRPGGTGVARLADLPGVAARQQRRPGRRRPAARGRPRSAPYISVVVARPLHLPEHADRGVREVGRCPAGTARTRRTGRPRARRAPAARRVGASRRRPPPATRSGRTAARGCRSGAEPDRLAVLEPDQRSRPAPRAR